MGTTLNTMVTRHKQLMDAGGVSKLHLAVFQGKQDKVSEIERNESLLQFFQKGKKRVKYSAKKRFVVSLRTRPNDGRVSQPV